MPASARQGLFLGSLTSGVLTLLQADRRTTIRQYMEIHGDILEEELPPELAERYGG